MAFSFRIGTKWCHDFPKLAKESGFYFNMHRSRVRIDWNCISNMDIDRIIREKDFHSIEDNINSVIDYCLESEYDVKILDPNFVKLFRLAQLAVEYLLYCKQYLDHSVVILKDELKSKIEENVKLKKEISTLEELVKHAKKRTKERSKFIESDIGDRNGEIYKCPHCIKTFISPMFVSAHIIRRHTYGSDLCAPVSPIHEHYRCETEKLHNEIKSLKERLNETERVIRNGSEKIAEQKTLDYNSKQVGNEGEGFKYENNHKSEEHMEYKGYRDEIKNLKTILFDEIHNLRQKDKAIHERTSETSFQALINQQEKEFQRLKNQLLEKLTPDIESVQAKVHAQENYWKLKLEHLENQHYKDVERLSTELKLAQKAADDVKAEYKSKVSDLERQTANQSSILIEQSKQLHSLTQELNTPELNGRNGGYESNLVRKYSESIMQDKSNEIIEEPNENISKQIDSANSSMQQIVDGSNMHEVTPSSILPSKIFPLTTEINSTRNIYSSEPKNILIAYKNESGKRKHTTIENDKKTECIKSIEENVENHSSSDISNSEGDLTPINEINSKRRHVKFGHLTTKTDLNESNINTLVDISNKNTIHEFLSNRNNNRSEGLEKYLHSTSNSESSISNSGSESITTIHNNSQLHKCKTESPVFSKSKENAQQSLFYKIQTNLMDIFEQKLRDLGIDPAWQAVPKATFKQKMNIIKHHQKLTAKKTPKYDQIKFKIIEELLTKVSRRGKQTEPSKLVRNSPSRKIITNTKSKTVKLFSEQENLGNIVSELQDVTDSQFYSMPKTSDIIKNVIKNESPIKSMKPISYSAIERLLKPSPNTTQNSDVIYRTINSKESLIRNDSSNKVKPSCNELFSNKLIETSDIDNSSIQRDLQSTLTSPKHNKSVLKSANVSTSSSIKKKVIFDLTNGEDGESLSDDNVMKEELSKINFNRYIIPAHSTSGEENRLSESADNKSAASIVLKTAQSEKIAEISKKLEAQLSMARQKPVGSVETMFAQKHIQNKKHQNTNEGTHFSSISSVLGSPIASPILNLKTTNDLLPQPAPRNIKDKKYKTSHAASISEISDLDSDIDRILKLE